MAEIDVNKKEYETQEAGEKPRDDEGHFVKEPLPDQKHKDPVGKLFSKNVHYSRKQEDLLDIRVGNPIQRIIDLLEEIKKQKAFSFTLKGSLGVAGVFLALSVFGVFGGGKILCDKGLQSQVGKIQALSVYEIDRANNIPIISDIVSFFTPKTSHQRVVLVKSDDTVIDLPYSPTVNTFERNGQTVIATGNYDACSHSLSLKDPSSIEPYSR